MSKPKRPQPAGLARAAELRRSELDRREQETARPPWCDPPEPDGGDPPWVEASPDPSTTNAVKPALERIADALERIAGQLENTARIVAVRCPKDGRT